MVQINQITNKKSVLQLNTLMANQGKYMDKSARILWMIFRFILLFCLSFVILYPLIYMVSVSLRTTEELYDPMVIYLPKTVVLENFTRAIEYMNYPMALLATMKLALTSTVFNVAICAIVGYGFARFNFKFKKAFFMLVLFSIIVPPQSVITPLYMEYRFFDFFGIGKLVGLVTGKALEINLIDTHLTFYIPALLGTGIRSGLFIYIFRQFFRGIPKELEEAAYIDGCGIFKTFVRIMLPSAKPSLLSCFLFSFVWYWNDYCLSAMFFKDAKTISMALATLPSMLRSDGLDFYSNPYVIVTMMQAACVLAVIPMLIVYTVLQKYFTESIERSGIVG